jgi:hypothetical protein
MAIQLIGGYAACVSGSGHILVGMLPFVAFRHICRQQDVVDDVAQTLCGELVHVLQQDVIAVKPEVCPGCLAAVPHGERVVTP